VVGSFRGKNAWAWQRSFASPRSLCYILAGEHFSNWPLTNPDLHGFLTLLGSVIFSEKNELKLLNVNKNFGLRPSRSVLSVRKSVASKKVSGNEGQTKPDHVLDQPGGTHAMLFVQDRNQY